MDGCCQKKNLLEVIMKEMSTVRERKMLCFDCHLDLSMNAMEWNRDQRWTVGQIRESEKGMTDKPDRGRNTVSFPALREGRIGLVVATQIARVVKPGSPIPGWYSQEQAWAQTQGCWSRPLRSGYLCQRNRFARTAE